MLAATFGAAALSVALWLPGDAGALVPAGSLDPSFGDGGVVTLDEPGTFLDVASHGGDDGHLIASGEWGDPSREPGIARFLSNGEMDGSFGGDGVVEGLPGPIAAQGAGVVVGGGGVITRLDPEGDASWTV